MAGKLTESFMRALQQAESSENVAPLVSLFGGDAELENPARSVTRKGRDGAERFWREYLSAFGRVRSRFTRVQEGDGFASLEWVSEGSLPSGQPVTYQGVSLIEFDGDGKSDGPENVRRFCTYYDSATFLPNGAKHAEPVGEVAARS